MSPSAAQHIMNNMSASAAGAHVVNVADHLLQMNGFCGSAHTSLKPSSSSSGQQQHDSSGKYVRYTTEQVHVLERLYNECPKPSSLRRQQLVRENPILQNIEAKQIKVWFQNRRCREKQRKETSRLQTVNAKLTAMNKLLMEENDRLQKQVTQLLYENGYIKQQLQQYSGIASDASCDNSVVTSGLQYLPTPQPHMQFDANYSGILAIAGDMLKEFIEKATGTATDWMQMPGMKPGPPTAVMLNLSCGVAVRACDIVNLEPAKIVEALKDRPAWHRDCRSITTIFSTCTSNGGCIEVVYIQMYAPTTLSLARDFCVLRYTCLLEDGNYAVCEKSLNAATIAPHNAPSFVRSDMYTSGCLVQRNEGSGCLVTIIDHVDPEPLIVPGVLEPYYQSSAYLAHKTTISALKYLRDIAQEATLQEVSGVGQQPLAIRSLSHRLAKGFNQAVNGFADEGWIQLPGDGSNDVKMVIRIPGASRDRELSNCSSPANSNGTLCATASVFIKNVSPSFLIRFLREHYSECIMNSGCSDEILQMGYLRFPGFHLMTGNSTKLQPQIRAVDENEFLELIKTEEGFFKPSDGQTIVNNQDTLLLQLCSGLDDNATDCNCGAQMVFAPIDSALSDDIVLISSGFRVIPLESKHKFHGSMQSKRTLDLASTLDVGNVCNNIGSDGASNSVDDSQLSVLTIALQMSFELDTQDNMKNMTRQYMRNLISTVQRTCVAMAPARTLQQTENAMAMIPFQDDVPLPQWICKSYKNNVGMDLVQVKMESFDAYNKALMNLTDAVICCTCEMRPVFTYANKRASDMLELCSYPDITRVPLQWLAWERIVEDEDSRKHFWRVTEEVMQQGYAYLPEGLKWATYRGRRASYERAIAWKVSEDTDSTELSSSRSNSVARVAFLFLNLSIGA